MSQENVEIIRRHHEAFISGNRDGAFEPLDPQIEFVFRRESGVEVRREAFQLWDMRDGKAIRCEVFDREADALEAAGLRE